MIRYLLGAAATVFISGCASIVVEKVSSVTSADGVLYALPTTVVRLALKLDRAEAHEAKFAVFAAIFAPDSKPLCGDTPCSPNPLVSYSLQPGTSLSTYGMPDMSNVYLVKFAGGGVTDQTFGMTWNEAGLLSSAASSVTNRSVDIAASGIKLLAGLGTKALGAPGVTATRKPRCEEDSPADTWVIPTLVEAGDPGAALVRNYCAIPRDKRALLRHDPTLLAGAVAAYDAQIVPLAGARTAILNGASQALDAASLLTKIESELDRELTTLYVGSTKTDTWAGTLDVRAIAVDAPLAILHIDKHRGICITNATVPPDAKPLPHGFATLSGADCSAAAATQIVFQYYPARDQQLFTKISDQTQGKRSFRYRIPARVAAFIDAPDGDHVGAGVVWVAQLGTVVSLPATRHSKTLSYELSYIEATGALKSFKLGAAGGVDTATVEALSSAGGTLIDARNAARTGQDEASMLTRQDQLLKLKDDICTLQTKYGLKCTVAP